MRRTTLLLVASVLIGLSACGSGDSTAKLNLATREFASHRYEEAYRTAREAAQMATGPARYDAHYVAGLCAYELGDLTEAEYRLTEAARSPVKETRAKATAQLGVVRIRQNRPEEASRLLLAAAPSLPPAHAEKARLYASIAAESRGGSLVSAQRAPVAASLGTYAAPAPSTSAFALQVGAFLDRRRAESRASQVRASDQAGLAGPVRVVTQLDERGRRFYVVQLGQYATRQEATRARTELGHLEYIVTHTGSGSSGHGAALAYP